MTSLPRRPAEATSGRSPAVAYEQLAVPALFADWAGSLVDLVSPPPGADVLDVGCGTGIVARTMAARMGAGGCLAGIDTDRAMLDVAQEMSAGVAARIDWYEGNAHGLPFDDASFDVVFCQQALQFFEDPDAALAEMRRVLRPGGHVAVDTWRGVQEEEALHALGATLARHLAPEAVGEFDAPCVLGTPDALGRSVSKAGFDLLHVGVLGHVVDVESAGQLLELAALITSLGPWLEGLTPDARIRLADDLDGTVGDPTAEGRLLIPLDACVAVGRR